MASHSNIGVEAGSRSLQAVPGVPGCPRGAGHAFTLIEVLVSVVILSVGIVMVLRAFNTSAAALGAAHDTLWNSLLIRQKSGEMALERARGGEIEEGSGVFTAVPGNFAWQTRTRQVSSGTAGELLEEISIEVWREGSRRQSMTTYLRTRLGESR